jgi:hypothetical protein
MPHFITRAWRAIVAVIGVFLRLIRDSVVPSTAYCLAHPATCAFRLFKRAIFLALVVVVFVLSAILALNVAFHTPLNVAFRALDPRSEACHAPPECVSAPKRDPSSNGAHTIEIAHKDASLMGSRSAPIRTPLSLAFSL